MNIPRVDWERHYFEGLLNADAFLELWLCCNLGPPLSLLRIVFVSKSFKSLHSKLGVLDGISDRAIVLASFEMRLPTNNLTKIFIVADYNKVDYIIILDNIDRGKDHGS